MGAQKITREELLLRCAETFRRLGYNGSTMDALAMACGLSKGAFYHHYSNKETLALEVLQWTHERVASRIFSIAYEDESDSANRLKRMHQKTKKLFGEDPSGCLMGIVSVDALHSVPGLMIEVRSFFAAWVGAFEHIYCKHHSAALSRSLAEQTVAEYEGAILMARIFEGRSNMLLDSVGARCLSHIVDADGK